MKIDQLPVEMLMKIFSYLPGYDEVSLVNRQFYNVVCNVNDSNIYLRLRTVFFEEEKTIQLLQTIQNTKRKITKLEIVLNEGTETQRKSVFSIIKKFSATIKYLRVHSYLYMPEFNEILSLIPNVEHLDLEFLKLRTDDFHPSQQKPRILPSNEELNLYQLKTLEFSQSSVEFLVVFNKLPVGVLSELSVSIPNLDAVNILFKRQTNIKKVDLRCFSKLSTDIFDNMNIEELMLCQASHGVKFDISSILSKQKTLKSLMLITDLVDEGLLNVVTNQLTELVTFSMNISKVPVYTAVNINKLRKLKELTLQGFSDAEEALNFLGAFAKLDNSRLFTLNVRGVFHLPNDLIHALAMSLPNVKVLYFECKFDCRKLMKSFNFVEVLQIRDLKYLHQTVNFNYLFQDDCFNPKLTALKINNELPYEIPFLEKLIAEYPNLKKFVIHSSTPLTTLQFQLILNGFSKMESLTLYKGASRLTIYDLDYLRNHKKNLKFISLKDLHIADVLKKRLSIVFDVVKLERGLHMAVDKITMKCERTW